MKEKLITLILVFSLTVNAAALITIGYFWGRNYTGGEAGPPPFGAGLSLDQGQRDRMRERRRKVSARVMEPGSEKLANSEIVSAAEHARDTEVVSVDLPAQQVDDTSDHRDDCARAETSSDSGADPAASRAPSDSEPHQHSAGACPAPAARSPLSVPARRPLCCIVCGRVGYRFVVRDVRGAGRRRDKPLVAGTGSGCRSSPMRC